MQERPFVWPTGSKGIFIGTTRAAMYSAGLREFGIRRVLLIDDSPLAHTAILKCRETNLELVNIPIGKSLPEREKHRFARVIVPWVNRDREKYLLIASEHAANRAPATAIAILAKASIEEPDIDRAMMVGVAIEIIANYYPFTDLDPELLAAFLESVGLPFPAACRHVCETMLRKQKEG